MKLINLLSSQHKLQQSYINQFAKDIKVGMTNSPKSISSKYLYDDTGSKLFKKITQLDEYYLTKTELKIIESIKHQLPDYFSNNPLDIIELGVGDGHKSSRIIESFKNSPQEICYYPIDISEEAFNLLQSNDNNYEAVKVIGILAEYGKGLQYIQSNSEHTKLILFLGSNIGNFTRTQAKEFLKNVSRTLEPGDYMFIGFDLKKDIDKLMQAYSDSHGVTRDFNLNMLQRINRELDANFDVTAFSHKASYSEQLGAMESVLLSQKEQQIRIDKLNLDIHFAHLEPLHLEYSFKYSESEVEKLAHHSGFSVVQNFYDDKHYFVNSLWQYMK